MKNLKKILSVVLAVALIVSIIAVAGATTAGQKMYEDYDQISDKYVDAVDLLTELGVLEGDQNIRKFMPKDTLDRAQMTKIAAYVRAQKDLSEYTTFERLNKAFASLVTFKDVSKTAWYAGPVGYAQQVAIVAGCGDDTFAPNRPVTIVEAAKMLLVVLGYDCAKENIGGPGWAGQVTTLAFKNGLFDNIDVTDVNRVILREEMAQMTYNMLLADTVYYKEGCCMSTRRDGFSAINWYFGKDVNVTTGIVVANGYANLLGDDTPDEFDATKNIVLLVKAGTCIGNGYCSGGHNELNANCPVNTEHDMLLVIDVEADENPVDLIGREVRVAALANKGQTVTYDTIVPTANNAFEVQVANGALTGEIKLDKDTIKVDHYQYSDVWYSDVDSAFAFDKYVNVPGYISYVIDNDNDGVAEFLICIESVLGQGVNGFDFESADPAKPGPDGVITKEDGFVFDGYVPAAGDVYLYHEGIDQTHVYAFQLEKKSGVIESYKGDATRDNWTGYFNGNYNTIKFEDTGDIIFSALEKDLNQYIEDQLTKLAIGDNLGAEGLGCIYYLDLGGNVIKLDLEGARKSVTALWYGIVRTNGVESFSSTAEGIGYDIIGVTKEGVEVRETLGNGLKFADDLEPWVLWKLFDNSEAVYAEVEFDRYGLVKDVKALTNKNCFTYAKGTLVLGSKAALSDVLSDFQAHTVLPTSERAVKGYIDDTTTVFNFNAGKGMYMIPVSFFPIADCTEIENWNNAIVAADKNTLGEVTVTKGPQTVADVFTYADFHGVSAKVGTNEIAEVVVLPFSADEYRSLCPIENAPVNKLTPALAGEYVFINYDLFLATTRVSKGVLDINGCTGYIYTVPCVNAAGEKVTVDIDECEYNWLAEVLDDSIDGYEIFTVTAMPGKYVVDLSLTGVDEEEYLGFWANVKAVSPVMDRFAYEDGENAYTMGYTADSLILSIVEDATGKAVGIKTITGDELTVGGYLLVIDNTFGANAFADTLVFGIFYPPVADTLIK